MSVGLEVGVIGAGYVGLTTGACFSHLGHRVACVDRDAHLVAQLQEGCISFYEPGLETLVEGGARQGRLRFSTDLASVVPEADVVFIAVDTPQGEGDTADLSSVAAVARLIGRILAQTRREHPLVVVNKSTVPSLGPFPYLLEPICHYCEICSKVVDRDFNKHAVYLPPLRK